MKMKLFFSIAVATLAVAGCGTPAHVSTGTIKATTFSFLHPGPLPEAAFTENRQHVHVAVQQAIASNLAAKGLRAVPTGGDVTVAYLIVVGNNATTSAINDYFGYGADAMALVDKAHKAYTENAQRNYFQAGTLLIDIVDARTQKVLARNYATRPVLQDPTAEARQANIQEAVNEALARVRFKS